MAKIAVIGSNSFSGSDLVDLLLDDPQKEVLGISRSPEKTAVFLPYMRRADRRFQFRQLDLNRDMTAIIDALDAFEPELIVNFAAQSEVAPSWENPEHWFQTNVVSLALLTNALRTRPYLRRYAHISSPEVYGACVGDVTESAPLNPSTPYAASKAAADLYLTTLVKQFDFPLITIRATNVYGAHQQLWKIIPRTAIYLKLGRQIQLHGGGAAVKSFIHIRDVSRGTLAAAERGEIGAIYHLSPDGSGYAVRDVVRRICELTGRDFDAATVTVGERPGQDAAYVINSDRARDELGWTPTIRLDDGLQQVIDWVEERWEAIRQLPLEYAHTP
ncbi:MAG: GDP-mannose 4,6-dehydratase [Candidatus Poribacteria bacterium]|nr:GDP-mannose 4,6-dehydratase [Candidatus Poribacteria bacterium]